MSFAILSAALSSAIIEVIPSPSQQGRPLVSAKERHRSVFILSNCGLCYILNSILAQYAPGLEPSRKP